jgi:hypothetical protein
MVAGGDRVWSKRVYATRDAGAEGGGHLHLERPGGLPAAGLTGGRVTLGDFLEAPSTGAERARVRKSAEADDARSLEQHEKLIETGHARSQREMLVAIENGDVPRYLARVGTKSNFDKHGTFAPANRPFVFATEPADLRGIKNPAEAMQKIGWTREAIEANLGQVVEVCILDTHAAVPLKDGGESHVSVGSMTWKDLRQAAMRDEQFKLEMSSLGIDEHQLEHLFDVLEQTPVRERPRTEDPAEAHNARLLRAQLDTFYGANELYSGMGATLQHTGELGGREVMIRPEQTGLKLTEANHVRVRIGKLKRRHLNALSEKSQ